MKRLLFVMASMALVLFAYRNARAQCCDGVTECGPSGSHTICKTTCAANDGAGVSGCIDLPPAACVGGGAAGSAAEICVCVAGSCFAPLHGSSSGCSFCGFPTGGPCNCGGVPGICEPDFDGERCHPLPIPPPFTALDAAACAQLVVAACEDAANTTKSCLPNPSCP